MAVLAGGTFILHDLHYALSRPFWNDEGWVVVTTRYPLTDLRQVTSSTPIGWSLLIRPFRVLGDQEPRLVPLLFAAASVILAFQLASGLPWPDRRSALVGATLAGFATLLVPAMLTRNDLKQYTADACLALGVLVATSRLERSWSRKWLVLLGSTVVGGTFFSHTTAFVGAAALTSLLIVTLTRRRWALAAEVAIAMVVCMLGMLAIYQYFDARAVVPGLRAYWSPYFISLGDGLGPAWDVIYTHVQKLGAVVGLGPTWLIALLVCAGLVALFRVQRPVTAVTILLLGPEMVLLAVLDKYPLLDPRTSTFLIVIGVVVAAIGVGAGCAILGRWSFPASIALAVAASAAFAIGSRNDLRVHSLPAEDVRSQAAYVLAHRVSTDVILVNLSPNWAFGYYWPIGSPGRTRTDVVYQGYITAFPSQPDIVIAGGRDSTSVEAALQRALGEAQSLRGRRIWLMRTRVTKAESVAWSRSLARNHLFARPILAAGLSEITVPA